MAKDKPTDNEARFEKGLRQIRYEGYLAESDNWLGELSDTNEGTQATSNSAKTRRLSRRRYLAVAATLLLLIAATAFFWQRQQTRQQYADLAQSTFNPPELLVLRGGTNAGITYQEGLRHYTNGNLIDASTSLSQIPDTSTFYAEGQFLLGLIALQNQDYTAAKAHFTYLQTSNDRLNDAVLGPPLNARSPTSADINWYLALAHTGLGEREAASELLLELKLNAQEPLASAIRDLEEQLDGME